MGRVSNKLWEAEEKLPDSIRKHTDKVIRTGFEVAKRLHPLREDTQRRGKAWVERHNPLGSKKKKRR